MKFVNENEYYIDDSIKKLVEKTIIDYNFIVSDKTEFYFINKVFLHKHYEYMKSCTAVVVHNTLPFIGIYYNINGKVVNNNGAGYISFKKVFDKTGEVISFIKYHESYYYNGERVSHASRSNLAKQFFILHEQRLESNFYSLSILKEDRIENQILWID